MPDSVTTLPALPAEVLAQFPADDLLAGIFATSITALVLLKPVLAADGTVTDFTFELLSEAAQRMLRLPARPTRTHSQLVPGTLAPGGIFEFYCEVLASGQPGHREFNYQLDGFDDYYRLAARRVGAGLLVSFTDTSDEERTPVEQALRESQAREQAALALAELERTRLEELLAQAPVAIGLFEGPELRITVANERMAALWGRPLAEVLGRPLLEAVPELRGQGFDELMEQVSRTLVPVTGTEAPAAMLRAGQMQTTYYNFVYQPLFDAHGTLRGVLDVAVEVTEQVLARRLIEEKEQQANQLNEELATANEELQAANEEILANNDELHRTQQALRELNQELEARVADRTHALNQALVETERQREHLRQQQHRLTQVLSEVPASVATLEGPEHRFSFFNANYQALVGGRARLGATVAEALPEMVPQGFIELLNEVFATGRPYVGVESSVMIDDAHTGQSAQRFIDFVYQPLTNEAGKPHGILAFVVDSTDKVLSRLLVAQANDGLTVANTALDTTNRQLTRTNADLDMFVYAASHDLRQPINNLVGLFGELERSVTFADPAEGELLLPMLHQALHQLSTTVDDLALVGQTQQNTGLPTEPVSLPDLTQEVLQSLQPQMQAARARVTVDFAAAPTVVYSRANLRTILVNLLGNSLKYADPARPCRVHVSVWKDAGRPVLLVEDNGLGFNMHRHQDELFQLFRRFHTHTEGTGVGLYLINRIVQSNGGRIEVESEVGEGTSFRVYL
ncbi:PAS domain-containing protein [Hymenobacter negativus]|uniref:histidine kinase n=1 Tax=Hymenobacter negativus TaxID=2795026 RepID=A0ABS0Q970_9BACT|nr:PAS domain-containing protein [Hymenobacter negativus]MBH8558888.1 PAS domain-containing protein [Hymenobacter negativus]